MRLKVQNHYLKPQVCWPLESCTKNNCIKWMQLAVLEIHAPLPPTYSITVGKAYITGGSIKDMHFQRKTNRSLKDILNYIILHDLHMNVTHLLGFWGSNLWSYNFYHLRQKASSLLFMDQVNKVVKWLVCFTNRPAPNI